MNGVAIAGGLELMLACDLRIASSNATFALAEVKWGLIPGAGGTQRLPRCIPMARALELILTGEPIDAQEAYRVGLINKVVSPDSLMAEAKRLADLLLTRGPLALRAAKEAVYRGLDVSMEEGLRLELQLFDHLFETEDAAEGRRAFAERRVPQFRGR